MSSAAMFTAVTGAEAQQIRIDVIANNLANLGTTGFKRVRANFEDLLYETVRLSAEEGGSPTGLQFGRGTRVVSTERNLAVGTLRTTDRPLDLAIDGRGFFAVQELNGDIVYTRDGSFRVNALGQLVNADGLVLVPSITIPDDAFNIQVTSDGRVIYNTPGSAAQTEAGQLQLTTFPNEGGLQAIGRNLFRETEGSGSPTPGTPADGAFGRVAQGMLEESNVNIAEELVGLILAQRAFEANTRVITAADDILRFVTQR
jgi:flagellar basal-body rod protein FlgG